MKKIVIFGATGLVGAYASLILKEQGFEVVAVGKRASDNGFFAGYGIPYYSADITKEDDFLKLPAKDVFAIVHLAGVMPASMRGYDPRSYVSSVVGGTLNVLEYARGIGADRIVFGHSRADSNYLMGKKPIPSDIVKKFPLTGDHSVYSICKNAAVDLIEHFYHQYGLKRFVLRFTTIYGYHPNPYFYVNGEKKMQAYRLIMDKAIRGERVEIWGDPSKAKEIVYVKDAVGLIRDCLRADCDGGVYNIGAEKPVTLEEQIRGIVAVFSDPNKPSEIVYRPDMPDGREYCNDISKTRNELGYAPQYDYRRLLVDFRKYMETEPMKQLWGTRENYD